MQSSTVNIGGTFSVPVVTKSAAYTITQANPYYTIICTTASGGGYTITLPTGIGILGRIYTIIYRGGTAPVTIAATAGVINGVTSIGTASATKTLVVTYQSDGTDWWVISSSAN